uniref:C2H2-type domain-containing protein n=1 Tax=Glossina brevipalpis TaxID=37001 RepID=A0A1A9WBP9_9MUSC
MEKCTEQYKKPQPLLKHLNEKHNFQLVRRKNCCTTFTTLSDFTLHLPSEEYPMNTAEELLFCPYYSKSFKTVTRLKQHLRIVHTQKKRQLCDKRCATVDHLKEHVLSQHQTERRHICHVCAKRFTQMSHLRQHLAIHTTGKTIKCKDCLQKFWRKIDLKRHKQKKHNPEEAT